MEEYFVKCFCDGKIKEGKIEILDNEDEIIMKFKVDELEIVRKASNYFVALIELRKELEPIGFKLLCKGCCHNVYPSRMSIDMCGGLVAYAMTMGKECDRGDLVRIFDECTLEEYATIDEQLLFFEQWYENIKLVRKARDKERDI